MSRDILGKLANGEELDEDDVAYATEHAIPLPEEYEQAVTSHTEQMVAGRPPDPVFQGGPSAPPAVSGPALYLDEDELLGLKNDTLKEIANVKGADVGGNKANVVSMLLGGASTESEEEDELEDDEEG